MRIPAWPPRWGFVGVWKLNCQLPISLHISQVVTRAATRHLNELAANFPVVAIAGPRQSGKTTLAPMAFANTTTTMTKPKDNHVRFGRPSFAG